MRGAIILCLLLLNLAGHSHEQTPTYPEWKPSGIDGIQKTTIRLWNSRNDVEFYEIGLFDDNWWPMPFVTANKIIHLGYLEEIYFDIYIRKSDLVDTRYVCSLSKLSDSTNNKTLLATKICSKFK